MLVFISACRAEHNAETNATLTSAMASRLRSKGFPYTIVTGVFDGVEEQSFMVDCTDYITEPQFLNEFINALARDYKQDCYLSVAYNVAGLFKPDGSSYFDKPKAGRVEYITGRRPDCDHTVISAGLYMTVTF